jgi:hypothetical protein
MPLGIPAILRFILVVVFTGVGCFAFYDLIIRRVGFLRPLFGLRESKPNNSELFDQKGGLIIGTDHPIDEPDLAKFDKNMIK